jgi:hypothetical protein
MKKVIIILLFLGNIYCLYSQNNNYINYYKAINRAELKIVDSLYNDATNIYDSAFLMVPKPFGKDYHNAALCTILEANYDKAFLYLEKLRDKGLDTNYFNKDIYKPLRNQKKWKDFIAKYNERHEVIMKSFDLKLRNELEEMYQKDQRMAQLRISKQYQDSFAILVYKNAERIIEIINTKGFPDENKLGVILLPHYNPVWMPLLHYIQCQGNMLSDSDKRNKMISKGAAPSYNVEKAGIDYKKYDLTPILMKASIEGKFPGHSFANMEEFKYHPVAYGCRIFVQVNETRVNVNYSKVEAHKVDSIRNNIGLESLANYQKKFYFFESLNNKDIRKNFFIDFQGAYMRYSFADEQQGKELLKQLIEGYPKN